MRVYVDCHFFLSVSHSDLMVRIPEQSGQYFLSLLVVGRWGRDWGGRVGLRFVTSGFMGRGRGPLQGFCPVAIRGGMEWGGRAGVNVAGVGGGWNCSSVFLTLADLWARLNPGGVHGSCPDGKADLQKVQLWPGDLFNCLLLGEEGTINVGLPWSGFHAPP